MKSKLRALRILFILLFIFSIELVYSKIEAATNLATNELIKVNNKTVTKTTTVEELNNMFGKYKIVTDNAFGGKSYSYYDDTYSWYLAIEMDASENIKGYGAIGGNFVAKRYAYGNADDSYYWYLSGTIIKEWDNSSVYGIYEYNCTSADVTNYWNNYKKKSSDYLYGLQQHSAVVSKVLAKREGYEFYQTHPSEEIFYMGEQLKYNNSSYYEYAVNSGKTKSIIRISSRIKDEFYNDLPNPIRLGRMTEGYSYSSGYSFVLYDVNMTDYTEKTAVTSMYYINPDFLAERNTVELLDDEKVKLAAANEQYALYNKYNEAIVNTYDEEPNFTTLPLKAGKYNKNVLLSVTAYLNVARAGLGIKTLELNEDIADAAQHKAVLVRYISGLGISAGHFPKQPEGVSDEFYKKAQTYMCENLYMGNIQSSIDFALNDGHGDEVECGHRYNLLEPSYTQWGAGCADNLQGVHKFGGTTAYTAELVAWPSNGIFPLDMVSRGIGNWTAHFYKNYSVSSDTEVTIKCLNTGKVYEINNENKDENGKFLEVTQNYLVTFRDDNIIYEDGDVFEITLHNVKNSAGEKVDYTYRSVFKKFYSSDEYSVTDIVFENSTMNLTLGQTKRIYTTVAPADATDKLMEFESLDTNIATVRQDGTITALKAGQTKIIVTCGNMVKALNVVVEKPRKGDINIDGLVDSADAAIALNIFKYNNATEQDIEIGDMDGNGLIDSADAAMILNVFKYGN